MTKLLDLLERVAPHIALFPRWAKTFFVATLASVALSVILYAALYDSALHARDAAAAGRDVTADLTGSGGNDIGLLKRRLARADSDRVVDYGNAGGNPTMRIVATAPYLDTLAAGGPIRAGEFSGISTADLPLLDLKVANNSKRVVYLTQAIFEVESSRPDPTAIPTVDELKSTPRAFSLANQGWGAMRHVVVRYRIVPVGTHRPFERPYPTETALGTVREDATVDVAAGVRAAGIDLPVLRRVEAAHHGFQYSDAEARAIRRAVGPFRGAKGLVAGELSYVTRTPSGRSRTRDVEFEAPISLVQRIQRPPFTPPAGPSYYNVRLRVSGSGYRQIVGISEALRPGGVKQFEIRVFAQRSSVHSFRVHLKYGAREIVTAPTELRLFVPRSHQIPQADDDVSSSGAS